MEAEEKAQPPAENTIGYTTGDKREGNEADNSLLSPHRILNIAHRGASGYAPEHTIAAYELGEELSGDYIEIDVQMTKDGELIAMHDSDLSRTANEMGHVHDFTLDEIQLLDVGSWFNDMYPERADLAFSSARIPTLDEIFSHFGKTSNYYIETKSPTQFPSMEEALVKLLRKHDLLNPNLREGIVVIQSFDQDSLLKVHELEPSLPLIQLYAFSEQATLTDAELNDIKKYAIGIGLNYQSLTPAFVKQVRKAGLLIHPYTVNERKDMERLIEWGVTGMFTNYPDVLDEVKRERGEK